MEKTNSIKKNAIFNSLYTLLNIVFPLITFPYASRCLLAEGMGKITFYTNVANYAMMLGSLGISTYGIKQISQVKQNKKELTKAIEELFLLNLLFSICIFSGLVLSMFFISKFRIDAEIFLCFCIYTVLAPLGLEWAYSGLEQYKYVTCRAFLCKIVSLILLVLFVHEKSDYIKYVLIFVFSNASAWIINFFYIRKFIGPLYRIKELEFKKHIKPMLMLFSSLLAVSVYTNIDTVMLGFLAGDEQVGYYAIATKIKIVMLSLVNAVSAVLLPRMSFYLQNNKTLMFKKTLKKSISVILCIAISCTFLFEISASETIWILGGAGYEKSILCMQIMMPILLISGFSNITGNQILIPSGNYKAFLTAVSCGAGANIILNAFLMPKYQSIGAAVATLVAELIQMGIQIWYAREYLYNNIDCKYILKIFLYCSVIAILIRNWGLCLELNNNLISFAFKGCLFFILFFIYLVFTKDYIILEIFGRFFKNREK